MRTDNNTQSALNINPVPTTPTPGASADLRANALNEATAAVQTFRETFTTALAVLYAALAGVSGDNAPTVSPSALRKQSAALYADLLRQHPDITARVSADAMNAGLALDTALAVVTSDFQQAIPVLESCGREAGYGTCEDAAVVRVAARTLAHRDKVLAAKITSIDAVLRRGKLVSTTVDSASKAQAKAAKTQQRTATQAAKAHTKAAKAARTAARAIEAHADRHPLSGDVGNVPGGTGTPSKP